MNARKGLRAICLVGDSFVHGTGDPHGGWAAQLATVWPDVTVYNLGVRRDTSHLVAERWRAEVTARAGAADETFCLLSWGANDADPARSDPHPAASTARTTARVLDQVRSDGYECLFVGPPRMPWPEHDRRAGSVDAALAETCAGRAVPYISLHRELPPEYHDLVVRRGNAHPPAAGYAMIWDAVRPSLHAALDSWLAPDRRSRKQVLAPEPSTASPHPARDEEIVTEAFR